MTCKYPYQPYPNIWISHLVIILFVGCIEGLDYEVLRFIITIRCQEEILYSQPMGLYQNSYNVGYLVNVRESRWFFIYRGMAYSAQCSSGGFREMVYQATIREARVHNPN